MFAGIYRHIFLEQVSYCFKQNTDNFKEMENCFNCTTIYFSSSGSWGLARPGFYFVSFKLSSVILGFWSSLKSEGNGQFENLKTRSARMRPNAIWLLYNIPLYCLCQQFPFIVSAHIFAVRRSAMGHTYSKQLNSMETLVYFSIIKFAGQHDRRVESLTGQKPNLGGHHGLLTGRCFQPCECSWFLKTFGSLNR